MPDVRDLQAWQLLLLPVFFLISNATEWRVHRDVLNPLIKLREHAFMEGFDLRLESGFRSFERQLSIWNRKASGELAVLDAQARPLDITQLSPRDLVFAILRWSALPGASRHHWGTDIDVFDAATTPSDYEIQLIPDEVEPGGMHAPMHEWLDERMARGELFVFMIDEADVIDEPALTKAAARFIEAIRQRGALL